MLKLEAPSDANQYYRSHIALLLDNYQRLLGLPLLEVAEGQSLAQRVFDADFALLSHTNDADPLFNYANRTALELFEFSWEEIIGMPSRFSAEPVNREERERLLKLVSEKGYISDYSGVRIAKSGKRFLIRQAVVWNVYDDRQRYVGQAACFSDWTLLP